MHVLKYNYLQASFLKKLLENAVYQSDGIKKGRGGGRNGEIQPETCKGNPHNDEEERFQDDNCIPGKENTQ